MEEIIKEMEGKLGIGRGEYLVADHIKKVELEKHVKLYLPNVSLCLTTTTYKCALN